MVIVQPGSLLQVMIATLYCCAYLYMQQACEPYKETFDDYLGGCCSLMLLVMFLAANAYKFGAFTEQPEVHAQGSHSAHTLHCIRALFSLYSVHCVWCRWARV